MLGKRPIFKALVSLFLVAMPLSAQADQATWSGSGDEYGGALPTDWNIDLQTSSASEAFTMTIDNSWLIHLVGRDNSGDFHRFYCDFQTIYNSGNRTINFTNAADFHSWVFSTCTVSYSETGLTEPDSLVQWSYNAGVITMNVGAAGLQFDNTGTTRAREHNFTLPVPVTQPDAPTSLNATVGDGQIVLAFNAPASDGGAAITDYEYQIDGGSWTSAGTTTSPITVNGLTNNQQYSFRVRAVNSAGAGASTNSVNATPATAPPAPTSVSTSTGDGEVSVAFSPPPDGGNPITDYQYQLDNGSWVNANTTTSPILITGLNNGTEYTVRVRAISAAGTGTASQAVTFNTAAPLSSFESAEEEVSAVIAGAAQRTVQNTLQSNRRMVTDARNRFALRSRASAGCTANAENGSSDLDCVDAGVSRNNIPLNLTGTAKLHGGSLKTIGSFFGQVENADGSLRRLVFGNFDIQHDGETDSTTATLSGRVAWERMVSDHTMLGYFVGAELSRSEIGGSFDGDQNSVGVLFGGYGVRELRDNLYADGFLTFGLGRNALEITDTSLTLESDYASQSLSFGGALTGVIDRGRYEVLPEISLSYAKTWIGDIGFTGRQAGIVDNTLVLDAGSISVAQIVVKPQMRLALDGGNVADSMHILSVAPRLICRSMRSATTEDDCGAGAELGIERSSKNGQGKFNARIQGDSVGSSDSLSFSVGGEYRF